MISSKVVIVLIVMVAATITVIVKVATVTVTVVAIFFSKCNSDGSSSNAAKSIRINS